MPSPVRVLTPVSGDAGTASWPCSLSVATSFDPMSPVPPMMTSFMIDVPFCVEPTNCRTSLDRHQNRCAFVLEEPSQCAAASQGCSPVPTSCAAERRFVDHRQCPRHEGPALRP